MNTRLSSPEFKRADMHVGVNPVIRNAAQVESTCVSKTWEHMAQATEQSQVQTKMNPF